MVPNIQIHVSRIINIREYFLQHRETAKKELLRLLKQKYPIILHRNKQREKKTQTQAYLIYGAMHSAGAHACKTYVRNNKIIYL